MIVNKSPDILSVERVGTFFIDVSSIGQPLTLETTARVPASFSAARMACGQSSRALDITSVKLPLPSNREMMLKGDRRVKICLGNGSAVKRCSSLGHMRWR